MKYFAFIFALYILLLSTVPCSAVDHCDDESTTASSGNNKEHDEGCQNCSPFTFCGNCNGFTIEVHTFKIEMEQQVTAQIFTDYVQSYLPTYIASFWQPPRLG